MAKVLLITAPLTQLNTPYPATAYLKGFFNSQGIKANQEDFGIELIDRMFSSQGLKRVFDAVQTIETYSDNAKRILILKHIYIKVIDDVIAYLRQPSIEKAYLIADTDFLPQASRFSQLDEMDWLFGSMGVMDKAKHFCTLFLEDLADFIAEVVDPHFGFSRYAERLGRSASSFDELYDALQQPLSLVDEFLIELTKDSIDHHKPDLVALSIPFPGNVFGALRIGQWIKAKCPKIKVCFGGGYPNTELRSLKDMRVLEFTDFITLDDGELPIQKLVKFIDGELSVEQLHRCYTLLNSQLKYIEQENIKDIPAKDWGTPDYSDLPMHKYLSVLEVANPMFRLWSDGRWLKMTLAHGCYWGKCTFCDGSLDYIGRYEPNPIDRIVDRMQQMMADTGLNGFHFVDEAAPPNLLKALALEIIKRQLKVTWWTNIRFERSFTADLCRLLKLSGCIAVSGGLEVASDRILKLINKGVDIPQVTQVTANLKAAGIMVHAYLMYGFPTQSVQETIDSLEVVRQLFDLELLTSGFWHQFAMTAHSDVGLHPEKYNVQITGGLNGDFANNDLYHADPTGAPHELFGEGLKKALYNFMHGIGLDWPVNEWFDFKVPNTQLPPNYLKSCLKNKLSLKANATWVWTGNQPLIKQFDKKKGKKVRKMSELVFHQPSDVISVDVKENLAKWIVETLSKIDVMEGVLLNSDTIKKDFENNSLGDFEVFMGSYTFSQLNEAGLLLL